jgi:hypothetical protein
MTGTRGGARLPYLVARAGLIESAALSCPVINGDARNITADARISFEQCGCHMMQMRWSDEQLLAQLARGI